MTSSEIIFDVRESADGGYEARALGYAIFTQADSEEELKEMVREAVRCHFAGQDDRPSVIRLHTVKDLLISA
jgi:predicted RNase H-like HicB family nuclease